MPLMKSRDVGVLAQSGIALDFSDIQQQAGRLVADAQAEGQRLVTVARTAAQDQAAALLEEARQRGRQEGLEQGRQEGRQKALADSAAAIAQLVAQWTACAQELCRALPAHGAQAHDDLVRLALRIAEKVTRQEGLRNRAVARETVAAALATAATQSRAIVMLNPADAAAGREYLPSLIAQLNSAAALEIQEDSGISPGGCILKFGVGRIDATLETQLSRIADELVGSWAQDDAPAAGGAP